jgi:hypothetical protein
VASLASALLGAQTAADASGEARTVLNLNTVGAALYVVRDYPGEEALARAVARNGPRFLVAVVPPNGQPNMRGGYTRPV